MSHTKASASWTLAAKRCSERYLFHPWNTSETWRSKQGRQTSLLFLATDRKKIEKDISLVTGRTSPDYLYRCLCVCLWRECYCWGQKIKGKRKQYWLFSQFFPSMLLWDHLLCRDAPPFFNIFFLIWLLPLDYFPYFLGQMYITASGSGFLGLCLTNWSCLCLLCSNWKRCLKGKKMNGNAPLTHTYTGGLTRSCCLQLI